jgi:hypothetical protein
MEQQDFSSTQNKLNQSYSFNVDKNILNQNQSQYKNLSTESLIKKPIPIKDKILDFNFYKEKKKFNLI